MARPCPLDADRAPHLARANDTDPECLARRLERLAREHRASHQGGRNRTGAVQEVSSRDSIFIRHVNTGDSVWVRR